MWTVNRSKLCSAASWAYLLCLLMPAAMVFAQEETTPEQISGSEGDASTTDVDAGLARQLLRRLQADQVADRDAAEKQLVELGQGVLEYLPRITDRTSGELKIRLQRIRQAFQSRDVDQFFEATKITLSGKMTVPEAVKSISEQSGNQISLQGADAMSGVEIELDVDAQDFWSVMEKLMSQAELRIVAFGTTGTDLVLSPGGRPAKDRTACFHSGPFRVEPMFLQSTRNINSEVPGQLQVSLQVTWEPRLEPVFMQIPMSSVEAFVSEGTVLQATSPQGAPEIPLNYGGCTTQIDLQVQRPDRSEKDIEKLVGEFNIAVPGERHRFEFEDFAKGSRQSEEYGDLTVILEGSRRNKRTYEIRLLVRFGNAQGALDSYRGWVMSNKAYIRDPAGRRLDDVGFNTYAMSNNAVGIAYQFSIPGDPSKYTLVYEAPATITKQTVRYELSDIPLP